jgi:hypothetical protein
MKKAHWIQLIALNLLVIVCIFLPFLPGPYDYLAGAISALAQTTGLIGLLLVPVAIVWLIMEIRKRSQRIVKLNNWTNGYYFAITATVICICISLFYALGFLLMAGPTSTVILLLGAGFAFYKLLPLIRSLRQSNDTSFHTAPLYLISIPAISFVVRMLLVGPASDYSRDYAIDNGQNLINAIEDYYVRNNHYPETIETLDNVAKPFIMGIEEFEYERNGDTYNLWFTHRQAIIATKEIVMYNKHDRHNVKGHYASFNTKKSHWKYYWLD